MQEDDGCVDPGVLLPGGHGGELHLDRTVGTDSPSQFRVSRSCHTNR
ncbi:hypothetical protein ACXC9Q_16935 [Kribbella sp. CWNU-51]